METFWKRTITFIMLGLAILSFFKIEGINWIVAASILTILLFISFIYLTLTQITRVEKDLIKLEEKFIRADELQDIKVDIKTIKNKLKMQ